MADSSNANNQSYSGTYYDLSLVNSELIITAKDNRGQILTSNAEKLIGKLILNDVKWFQNVKETLVE
ncbi:MAG: hypothetical protein PUP93_10610 [Rhizonema sp. NSF051]|nr:hypothetical protein [Rhizonema sp. NSF051]